MMVITTEEILIRAPPYIQPSLCRVSDIHARIEHSLTAPPPQTTINISDVVLDVENLADWTHDEVVDSNEASEYIEFQRLHKLKFLKEVRDRGLVLTSDRNDEGGGARSNLAHTFMNY
ncbi:uncharacterized protein LODBEIA_P40680 [Lodderomyces beijingensis]|uniref:Uncharacterized protein n=1 Tax=Lodderomyces beijingensis TaxID=1775926 RepID=A0ABP0ZPK1_9ASCO